jgi:hypothetical protein
VEHRVLDLLFLVATCGLLGGALARLRSRSQGLLAVVILASTPIFLEKGSSQYADMPLGYFFLATGVLLSLHEATGGRGHLAVLAGAMAGFAAWTKNEGLLFLLAVMTARLVVVVRAHGWREWGKEVLFFGLGLLPALACLVYFKTRLAPPNDLVAGQGLGPTIERLLSADRYGQIAGSYVKEALLIGPWTVVVLVAYFLLLGKAPTREHRTGLPGNLLVLAFMMGGYTLIFLTTPHDLDWHLGVVDRLLMQLWPLALFTYFLTVATPEEALARKKERTKEQTAM